MNAGVILHGTIVKNLAQNDPSRFAPNPFAFCDESQTDFAANDEEATSPQLRGDEPEEGTRCN
jgi:hypothetical protein